MASEDGGKPMLSIAFLTKSKKGRGAADEVEGDDEPGGHDISEEMKEFIDAVKAEDVDAAAAVFKTLCTLCDDDSDYVKK